MGETDKLTEQLAEVEATLAAIREAVLQAAKESHEARLQAKAAEEAIQLHDRHP